ncbi:MAG: class I SAM-dependent methyltransferase [Limnospira sp. PMC 1238.20]|uniref:class I SAM-dependent methyltransferase n=1 Tax=unclassified Limnospira TaxID=2642885 RepID=UPI0028E0D358|nr:MULTISPECIES: class I SAM-dependent methyltransferase [unclassified Limnospira]MDT9179482.1 class I SAM-dependent methyltransferase [Limnospira sp. PMC 1238.20]MDT9229431.1 class I SAM-dependent methyltransferase [Limnospira sp. PMC 1242.20]MDT9245947.1 class I SAM-dependent methyltransferase [Limnospira sp. PMC 1249.20]
MSTIEDFRQFSDSEWLNLLIESVKQETVQGLHFPKFPPDSIQAQFVGSSGENSLREAYRFYDFFKNEATKAGAIINKNSTILDFGTGWGRFLRFFWKDVSENGLHGVDIDPSIIELCRSLGVPGNLQTIDPLGSLPYSDSSLDFILAYSVFTHLPENVHLHWMQEFKRVVRSGGIVAITIEPRRFLEFVAGLKNQTPENAWHAGLQKFSDYAEQSIPLYDSGDLVYLPTGGGAFREPNVYGDAVCPVSFLEKNWMPEFSVRSYIDDPKQFWQAAVILKRT